MEEVNIKDLFTHSNWKNSVERCGISIQDYVNNANNTLNEWLKRGCSVVSFTPKCNADYGGTLEEIVQCEGILTKLDKVYITKVLYNNPATIVFWSDGTQTRNICPPDTLYNPDAGLAFCMLRKLMGNDEVAKLFKDWELKDYKNDKNHYIEIKDVRKIHKDAKKK